MSHKLYYISYTNSTISLILMCSMAWTWICCDSTPFRFASWAFCFISLNFGSISFDWLFASKKKFQHRIQKVFSDILIQLSGVRTGRFYTPCLYAAYNKLRKLGRFANWCLQDGVFSQSDCDLEIVSQSQAGLKAPVLNLILVLAN